MVGQQIAHLSPVKASFAQAKALAGDSTAAAFAIGEDIEAGGDELIEKQRAPPTAIAR